MEELEDEKGGVGSYFTVSMYEILKNKEQL